MAAKVAEAAGGIGEKVFDVTMRENKKGDGKPKPAQKVQLKVGQMAIQLFELFCPLLRRQRSHRRQVATQNGLPVRRARSA